VPLEPSSSGSTAGSPGRHHALALALVAGGWLLAYPDISKSNFEISKFDFELF
jgi:hypothetical protein